MIERVPTMAVEKDGRKVIINTADFARMKADGWLPPAPAPAPVKDDEKDEKGKGKAKA